MNEQVKIKRLNEECAGCFRRRRDDEAIENWLFWEMCGSGQDRAKVSRKELAVRPRFGAWLCPVCAQEQKERRARLSRIKDGRYSRSEQTLGDEESRS
jgi:hypothetical protein